MPKEFYIGNSDSNVSEATSASSYGFPSTKEFIAPPPGLYSPWVPIGTNSSLSEPNPTPAKRTVRFADEPCTWVSPTGFEYKMRNSVNLAGEEFSCLRMVLKREPEEKCFPSLRDRQRVECYLQYGNGIVVRDRSRVFTLDAEGNVVGTRWEDINTIRNTYMDLTIHRCDLKALRGAKLHWKFNASGQFPLSLIHI